MTNKFTDWKTWWDGLRTNLIKCIGTTGTMWLGSNGAASIGIDWLKDVGFNWKQALGLFGVHVGIEVFTYMRDNQPKVITETMETTHITKTESGTVEQGSSKTVTVTPIETKP